MIRIDVLSPCPEERIEEEKDAFLARQWVEAGRVVFPLDCVAFGRCTPPSASITGSIESVSLIQMVAVCQRIALIWQSVMCVRALVHVAFRFSDGSRRSCRHSSCTTYHWTSYRCIAGLCAEKQRSGLNVSPVLVLASKAGVAPRFSRSIWLKLNTRHRSLPGSEGRDLPWLFG